LYNRDIGKWVTPEEGGPFIALQAKAHFVIGGKAGTV